MQSTDDLHGISTEGPASQHSVRIVFRGTPPNEEAYYFARLCAARLAPDVQAPAAVLVEHDRRLDRYCVQLEVVDGPNVEEDDQDILLAIRNAFDRLSARGSEPASQGSGQPGDCSDAALDSWRMCMLEQRSALRDTARVLLDGRRDAANGLLPTLRSFAPLIEGWLLFERDWLERTNAHAHDSEGARSRHAALDRIAALHRDIQRRPPASLTECALAAYHLVGCVEGYLLPAEFGRLQTRPPTHGSVDRAPTISCI